MMGFWLGGLISNIGKAISILWHVDDHVPGLLITHLPFRIVEFGVFLEKKSCPEDSDTH